MALLLAGTARPGPVAAEPVLDRSLSGAQLVSQKGCAILKISFNFRVRYSSHFPIGRGEELRIRLRPIDPGQAAAEIISQRESLRAPDSKLARIRSIEFDVGNAAGPVLVIQFYQPMSYQVGQGSDFQSLVIAISGKGASSTCKAELPVSAPGGAWNTTVSRDAAPLPAPSSRRTGRRKAGTATQAQKTSAGAWMDEGRAALRKNEHAAAIALFDKILALPETEYSAEAQELLGLALQRSGKSSEAQAAYSDYLALYPDAEGTERVRQRLAGISPPEGESGTKLRSGKRQADVTENGSDTRPTTWTISGSASQFYIRDDSFRTLRDPTLPPDVNAEFDDHRVHQNELLSSFDFLGTWNGDGVKSKFRFSGSEEHSFNDDEDEIVSVAALFFDTAIKDYATNVRIGRQTRNTGGVLGRFDGGILSVQPTELYRLNAVVGSPVARRSDLPFEDERYFYGASVDIGPFFGGFDATLFAIEQRDRDILDRQAVGGELRYFDADKSAFATIDYDIHYQELNAAILTGSWTLPDKTALHAEFDYRRSPYLSTWTALQGQQYPTLFEMLRHNTIDEIEQYAVDRTASYTSYSAGIARPLNGTFQVSLDATVANAEGTISSGGVEASPSTGYESYYSAQLIGTGVFRDEDLFIAGLRYADLDQTDNYVLDLSARYPLIDDLKVNPRLRLGYVTGDMSDLEEYSVLPSVLFNYYVTRDMSLELEIGAEWTDSTQGGVEETSTDLFLTVGYRYDFYADGTLPQTLSAYGSGANSGQQTSAPTNGTANSR